jgi:hypothetical protein
MYTKIGRVSPSTSGVNPLRGDYLGGLITSTAGDYKDVTLANRLYFAYCASQNATIYSATGAIGLQIYNPANSGVNLVIHKWSCIVWANSAPMTGLMLAVANAAVTVPSSTTACTLTGRTSLTGTTLTTGSCSAYSACTIAAPVAVWPLFHNTVAINSVGAEKMDGDLQGSFGFAPGTVAVIAPLGGTAVTINLACTYEEVPVGL